MSKDDMHIVMYKILKYLYECMKVGKDAELKDFCWDSEVCQINKQYWKDIIAELSENGFVKGIKIIPSNTGAKIKLDDKIKVTVAGVEYMQTNSTMQKAKVVVGEAFEAIVASLIGIIE